MVSLQSPLSPNHRTAMIPEPENISTTPQKRKAFDQGPFHHHHNHDHYYNVERQVSAIKRPKTGFQNFMMPDIELHLETPLPSEWQRCLDIQSGKIHFYNTKTHARTSTDPREIIPQDDDNHHDRRDDRDDDHHSNMSLDLELNLTTSEPFVRKDHYSNHKVMSNNSSPTGFCRELSLDQSTTAGDAAKQKTAKSSSPAWLALEADRRQQEMVATVCMRCHMLVMLCRSSPACPNCKFVHPPDKTPSNFVDQVKL